MHNSFILTLMMYLAYFSPNCRLIVKECESRKQNPLSHLDVIHSSYVTLFRWLTGSLALQIANELQQRESMLEDSGKTFQTRPHRSTLPCACKMMTLAPILMHLYPSPSPPWGTPFTQRIPNRGQASCSPRHSHQEAMQKLSSIKVHIRQSSQTSAFAQEVVTAGQTTKFGFLKPLKFQGEKNPIQVNTYLWSQNYCRAWHNPAGGKGHQNSPSSNQDRANVACLRKFGNQQASISDDRLSSSL